MRYRGCRRMSKLEKKALMPKLRFKDDKGKEYPGWEEKKLDDCLDYVQPTQFLVKNSTYDDRYKTPVLTAGKTFILGYTNESQGIFSDNLPVIIFDDFTTSTKFVDFPFKAKSSAMKILLPRENSNIRFFHEAMQMIKYEVGEHKRHYISIFSKFNITTPSLKEQQKIADCLTSIDDLITAQTQKIDTLKAHKKGLMQQLFPAEGETTPKLRFTDDKGKEYPGWEKRKLGDVGKIIGGGTPDTNQKSFWDGGINWFTPTEIKSKYSETSIRKISEEGLSQSSATLLPAGTILFTSRATIGRVSVAKERCSTNQGFQSIKVNNSFSNEYIYYWILQNKNQFLRRANGSTFLEIGRNEIKKIPLYIPLKKEQQKIADCLTSIDDLITAQTQKVETLKAHKKGLMQQLFPTTDKEQTKEPAT